MRPVFRMHEETEQIISDIVPDLLGTNVFRLGSYYRFTKDVPLGPYGTIGTGTRMKVIERHEDCGAVDLEFLTPHERLGRYLTLIPFETDDIAGALTRTRRPMRHAALYSYLLVALTAFAIGIAAPHLIGTAHARHKTVVYWRSDNGG